MPMGEKAFEAQERALESLTFDEALAHKTITMALCLSWLAGKTPYTRKIKVLNAPPLIP